MKKIKNSELTNTQALETLKKIEETIKELKNMDVEEIEWRFGKSYYFQKIDLLEQEANKIGEELIGCGEEFLNHNFKTICGCRDYYGKVTLFCPTCQEAKEILERINGK